MTNYFYFLFKKVWILIFYEAIFVLVKVQKLTELLSRKVEGLDPLKPWQPFIYREGATFY